MAGSVDITIGEIVLTGVPVADRAGLADAVATRLAGLVRERGLPVGPAAGEAFAGPITVALAGAPEAALAQAEPGSRAAHPPPDALAGALAEAIWTGIGREWSRPSPHVPGGEQ
jgi:hypothetical protein